MPRAINPDVDPEVHRPMRVLENLTMKEIFAVKGVHVPEDVRRMTHDNIEEINQSEVREDSDPLVYRIIMAGTLDTDQIMAGLGMPFDRRITQENFPLRPDSLPDDRIETVDPKRSFTEEEGLQILADNKLDRPSYRHGIHFAEQYGTKTVSGEESLVLFLHEAWMGPGETPRIMYLCRGVDRCRFGLMYADQKFSASSVLAGVVRRMRSYVAL
jgi:hypothetical protein